MNKVFFSGLLLFATSSFAAEVVLEKNGVTLTDEDIFAAASDLSDMEIEGMRKNSGMLRTFIEQLFDNKVMSVAISKELENDKKFQVISEMSADKFANHYYVKKKALEKIDAVKDFKTLAKQKYHSNLKQYQLPQTFDYYHVLFLKQDGGNAKEKAEKLSQNIKDGQVKLSDAAKQYHSLIDGTDESGVLKNMQPEHLVEALQEKVLKMNEGDVSDVVETPVGYHIIGLKKKNPIQTKPFDKEIEKKIVNELKTEMFRATNREIREKYKGPNGLDVNSDLLESVSHEILKK